ncbi:hypothetical protein OG21DRAFT_1508939 [Imleria badia]|nr:hypothetical protein OG21DRAFT_1508939 [Imleria badia]
MYGQASGLSNNPFVEDPTSAHARFPDLSASTSPYPTQPQQYPPQYHPSYASSPYQQQMAPQNQFASPSYAPQYPPQGQLAGPQSIGAFQQPTPTGFTQQYPMQSGYPMSYSSTGYPQTTNATPSYLAEFDPYAQAQAQQSSSQLTGTTPSGTGPPGISHPRDVIRTHKSGLEAWDTYSWKQLFSACDALKEVWSARRQQAEGIVRQYGGLADPGLFGPDPAFGYNNQVEGWKQVLRDANDHFDTVAASTFQLHEVFNSYRQSGDQASKRRVRESCNAAVKGLPDWPSN